MTALQKIEQLFTQTDEALSELHDASLFFPNLMEFMATKFQWNVKELREYEPVIRFYVRNHNDYEIKAGIKGGIKKRTEKSVKVKTKPKYSSVAMEQVQAALNAKLASKTFTDLKEELSDDLDDLIPAKSV